ESVKCVHGIAFSPDGKLLAASGADGGLKVWSFPKLVAALPPGAPRPAAAAVQPVRELSAGELEQCWNALGGDDAAKADKAIEALERMGTREARQLLSAIAGGVPEARAARAAKAALSFLAQHPATER